MFLRDFKVKSSSGMKSSERKRFKIHISNLFRKLSPEDVDAIVSPKQGFVQTKVLCHSGDIVTIYVSKDEPVFFLVENQLFPTVYLLWKFPNLVKRLVTYPTVASNISNGADLMAPGVIVNSNTMKNFENIRANDICSITLEGNNAPFAVGLAAQSDHDLKKKGRTGKAVYIHHFYKDSLWYFGSKTRLPQLYEKIQIPAPEGKDSCPSASCPEESKVPNVSEPSLSVDNEKGEASCDMLNEDVKALTIREKSPDERWKRFLYCQEYSMESILQQCFYYCLQIHSKRLKLPVTAGSFFKTHVLSLSPPELDFDIKKTSYRKLSVFLRGMCTDGVITCHESSPGVVSITDINFDHEDVISFEADPLFREYYEATQRAEIEAAYLEEMKLYKFPDIAEVFVVTANLEPLFQRFGFKKADTVSAIEVRNSIAGYVKECGLQDDKDPKVVNVHLDPVLSHCLIKDPQERSSLTWQELFERLFALLSPANIVTFKGEEPKLIKGHLKQIDVSVTTRHGNKKVTLISNLDRYGIDSKKFANDIQFAVAASTSVAACKGERTYQVLIQGNHLKYLKGLLIDDMKIPMKYIKGLEKVANASQKKK